MENANKKMEQEQRTLEYEQEDIKVVPDLIDGVITNIVKTTAKNVFGDKAEKPDQEMLSITIENKLYGVYVNEYCTYFDKGGVPDNSKLGKIIDFYNGLKTGMRVQLLKNKNGFFDIRK